MKCNALTNRGCAAGHAEGATPAHGDEQQVLVPDPRGGERGGLVERPAVEGYRCAGAYREVGGHERLDRRDSRVAGNLHGFAGSRVTAAHTSALSSCVFYLAVRPRGRAGRLGGLCTAVGLRMGWGVSAAYCVFFFLVEVVFEISIPLYLKTKLTLVRCSRSVTALD